MATPTLKRSWSFVGLSGNDLDTGNNFKVQLEASGTPCAVTAGDFLLVSVGFHNGLTCTVSDDQSNTWTSAISVADATLGTPRKWQIFWAIATAGMTTITVGLGATTTDIQIAVSLWYNTASSSPIDGAGIATTQITGPTVASGSFSTTVDGDLIYNIVWDEQTGLIGQIGSPFTGVTFGAGFTGLFSEIWFGQFAQYQVQGTHGAINPTMTLAQATNDVFTSISIAIKPGTSGSAPGAGIRINASQMYRPSGVAGNQSVWFPSSGNLIVVANDVGPSSENINSITDTSGNTYQSIDQTLHSNGEQLFHADNAVTGSALKLTINLTNNNGVSLFALYDIAGAATSPLDVAATGANSSVLTSNASGATTNSYTETSTTAADAASITPSTAHGLIINPGSIGNGPATACTTGTMDYVTFTGMGDTNGFANGDLMGHFFNGSAATQNFTWTVVNNSASISGTAVAFKAAAQSFTPDEDYYSAQIVWPVDSIVSLW